MKTFKQFINQNESKNPYLDSKGRDMGGVYGQNPPIHGLASGNKYRNDILDTPGEKQDQYLQEPEVMKFFKDNDNKIRQTSDMPSLKTKYYTNKFVNVKASETKGRTPAG